MCIVWYVLLTNLVLYGGLAYVCILCPVFLSVNKWSKLIYVILWLIYIIAIHYYRIWSSTLALIRIYISLLSNVRGGIYAPWQACYIYLVSMNMCLILQVSVVRSMFITSLCVMLRSFDRSIFIDVRTYVRNTIIEMLLWCTCITCILHVLVQVCKYVY